MGANEAGEGERESARGREEGEEKRERERERERERGRDGRVAVVWGEATLPEDHCSVLRPSTTIAPPSDHHYGGLLWAMANLLSSQMTFSGSAPVVGWKKLLGCG